MILHIAYRNGCIPKLLKIKLILVRTSQNLRNKIERHHICLFWIFITDTATCLLTCNNCDMKKSNKISAKLNLKFKK